MWFGSMEMHEIDAVCILGCGDGISMINDSH